MAFGRQPPIRQGNENTLVDHRTLLGLNWDPLFSLAPGLTDAQLKRAGLTRNLPGRPRAPRLPEDVADKLLEVFKAPPPSGPGGMPITEPTEEELSDLEAFLQAPVDLGPAVRVLRRTPVNFHFTGNIAGGAAASEIRVFGPVPNPFDLRTIELNPITNIEPGQFLDVLISNDDNATDTATPSGLSLFPQIAGFDSLPAADQQRGMKILSAHYDLPINFRVTNGNMSIKVRSFFVAPAIQLPNLSVTIIVEELTGLSEIIASPFPPVIESEEPPPSAPPPPQAAPVVDSQFRLQIGSPMKGFGNYNSEEDATAAAKAASAGDPGIRVRVFGAQTKTTFFEAGTRMF